MMNFASPYIELPKKLSVRQNLEVYARLYGVKKIFERIDEVVTRIGFGSSLKTYRPHITLGRFKDKDRPQYSFEDFGEIQITSRVNKLDVYESEFDEGKTNYQLLKSFEF